ncbi:metallophosphoesterase [Microbacterium sp.]|uniref:metallophosphoesterase family protein n=1 Tax=Microbacterium sp. TaxID=51671 RepID=UPI002733E7B2|nr:metallophosphoesterase [Microbacterium sp.]MDP3952011.1 metallophosphoesterase [Microbacterium sp.]
MSRASGRLTVLHVSDVHATHSGLLYDAVDGLERLQSVGEYARRARITPEAVVVTGDLIQRGNSAAYGAVRDALADLEQVVQAPVLTVLGNHDEPDAARMLRGHEQSHHRTVLVAGLRIILLDTSSGELGHAQREWLAGELAIPHRDGTIIALHHPPLGSPLPTLAKAGLRDAEAFLDVVEGTDARVILAGHFHHPLAAHLRGIPVTVGPSLAYHQVMDARPDLISGHDRAMFSIVHLLSEGMTATSVSLESPSPLFSSAVPVPAHQNS